jgi:serine/threonine protein kinase
MSPERFQADKFSFPSDIWSLGLVVLECYLGSFPIVGSKNGYVVAPAAHSLQLPNNIAGFQSFRVAGIGTS